MELPQNVYDSIEINKNQLYSHLIRRVEGLKEYSESKAEKLNDQNYTPADIATEFIGAILLQKAEEENDDSYIPKKLMENRNARATPADWFDVFDTEFYDLMFDAINQAIEEYGN